MADPSPHVLEHFRQPRNAGLPSEQTHGVGSGRAGALKSGVEVVFRLRIGEGGAVGCIGWECLGCPATIACCSWASERVLQHGVAGVPSALDMQQALNLAPEVLSRALVVEDALRAAVADAEADRA